MSNTSPSLVWSKTSHLRQGLWDEKVLDGLMRRGVLSRLETSRVLSLLRAGLTLEQAVCGTGLLCAKTYDQELSFTSGLPAVRVVRFLDGILDRKFVARYRALPFAVRGKSAFVAFARPEREPISAVTDALSQKDLSCMPHVMPESSLWPYLSRETRRPLIVRLLDELRGAVRCSRDRGVHLINSSSGGVTAMTDSGRALADLDLCSHHLPAAVYRLARLGEDSGWTIVNRAGSGVSLRLTTAAALDPGHPLSWSGPQRAPLRVVMVSDQSLAREIANRRGSVELLPVETDDERELALHAVLSGKSLSVWTTDDSPWWEPVLDAGLSVAVFSVRGTAHGLAWTSYLEKT